MRNVGVPGQFHLINLRSPWTFNAWKLYFAYWIQTKYRTDKKKSYFCCLRSSNKEMGAIIYMEDAAISFSNLLVAMRKHYEIIKKM